MDKPRLAEFGRIDQTADPGYFVRFLDEACAAASVQTYKRRMLDLLDIRPGQRILDVGCGTGDDVREMARLAGTDGLVVGLDNSQAMIEVARERAAGQGLPVEFRAASASNVPFEADTFDASRADRSLMHVPDARQALAEMVRVTRPGGRIVVYEVDFETLVIDADDRMLARTVVNTWCDGFRNGWLGRHIPALLADLGLRDMEVVPHTMMLTPEIALRLLGTTTAERAVETGRLSPAEAQRWLECLETMQRSGRFFSSMTGFLAFGKKGET